MAETKRTGGRTRSSGKARSRSKARAPSQGKAKESARSGGASKEASRKGKAKASARSSGARKDASRTRKATSRTSDGSRSAGSPGSTTARDAGTDRSRGMSAMEAARFARRHIAELLGRPVEGVLGVDRDHGNWIVTAQVVELERIPNTMDVLGDYEAVLDKEGEVVVCRRTHRYRRGQVDEGQ